MGHNARNYELGGNASDLLIGVLKAFDSPVQDLMEGVLRKSIFFGKFKHDIQLD